MHTNHNDNHNEINLILILLKNWWLVLNGVLRKTNLLF